jgi:lipopolysaccharide export LptBFGC system permease protein LptF
VNSLERYVARLMVGAFVPLALGLVTLFLVIDLGDWLRIYIGRPVADVALVYWYRSHVATVQFAPAALVLSAGLAVATVRRRGEWIAMRALGASSATLLKPVAIVAIVASCGLVAFQEFVVSRSGPLLDRLMLERFERWGDFVSVYSPRRWFRVGESLLNVRGEQNVEQLSDVRIFTVASGASLTRWIEAGRLTWTGEGRWRADEATELLFEGPRAQPGRRGTFELELALRPEVTRLPVGRPEWLPLTALTNQRELLRTLELPTEATRFAIHARFSGALGAVLAALIACLLGLGERERASVPRALIEGAGLYGGLFLSGMISRSLAINGHLGPAIAAWAVPLGLLPVTVWLLRGTLTRSSGR